MSQLLSAPPGYNSPSWPSSPAAEGRPAGDDKEEEGGTLEEEMEAVASTDLLQPETVDEEGMACENEAMTTTPVAEAEVGEGDVEKRDDSPPNANADEGRDRMKEEVNAQTWVQDKIVQRMKRYCGRSLPDQQTYAIERFPVLSCDWDARGRLTQDGRVARVAFVGYVVTVGWERSSRTRMRYYVDLELAREVDHEAATRVLQHFNDSHRPDKLVRVSKDVNSRTKTRVVYDASDRIHPVPTDKAKACHLDSLETQDVVYVECEVHLQGEGRTVFHIRAVHVMMKAPDDLD